MRSLLLILVTCCCIQCDTTSQDKRQPVQVTGDKQEKEDFDPYFTPNTDIVTEHGPRAITRNVFQDSDGRIWLATWKGIMEYDGQKFINHTNKEGLRRHRIFCIMQDKRGDLWFGSIGAGLYHYDGDKFTNITAAKNGLADDRTHCFYEDSAGKIWIGTNEGISIYDPSTNRIGDSVMFRNLTEKEGLVDNEVNSIVERDGVFWIGTRGAACTYDGEAFGLISRSDGRAFQNIRRVMLDRHGAIWLGGNAGLWRYADGEYTQISMPFCGYMYEDRAGNIWANAQSAVDREAWTVSRYEGAGYPVNTYSEVRVLDQKGMFFDIMEDTDGNIWVGKLDGTCRISGEEIECFE